LPDPRRRRRPCSARAAAIGFVPPKSACALRAPAEKSAQPRSRRDRGPAVGPAPRGGHGVQAVECLDGRLAPRQGPALIAVEPHQSRRDIALAEAGGHDLQADAADAQHVHLRLGDAERGGAVRLARALPGDPPRQRGGLGRERRVGQHRHVQPMAQRIPCHHGLAGGGARAGAARRIGPVGGADSRIRHGVPLSPCTPDPGAPPGEASGFRPLATRRRC
jgi:hypothetical protein